MYLNEQKFYYTGTLMGNRKNFPAELKESMKHLESKYFRNDSGVLACAWQDKKAKKTSADCFNKVHKG